MRKIICIMLVFILNSAVFSKAEIQMWFQTMTATALIDHNANPLAGDSLFLVFWTLDSTINFNNINPLAPLGDDVLLDQTTTFDPNYWSQDGSIIGWQNNKYGTGSNIYAPTGHVYIAAFELPYASYSGTIAAGTYYGLGPVTTLPLTQYNGNSSALPDDYGALLDATPLVTSLQTVPEPATWSLLCLGVVTVASRLRRKKS